ncbi:lytic transglycosylase catalytic [Yersinia rohdei]|uniref:lytic transglycosylase catalytic n=1 Tax=Yersinia rohdei TaxID=29485 RepID=UPI0011A8B55A|nr:lytic transglycosylase catalytic [Yersinia rohdei]
MSNAETIKDFLVSLGFELDEAGEKKFSAVIAGVTANVLKMGAVVEGAALAVVGFTTKIASGLDKVYFASQRTGASVAGIKALGYAASQLGVDAASAQGSLESLARFIRNSPGAEGFLNRLGVQTRTANGGMRDTSAIFTGLSVKLSSMPYYRANQYAQMLGIDENTLMAMRKGLGSFNADYKSMLKATGLDSEKAAAQSNKFMTSMRSLTSLFGMARNKIGADLAGGLSGSLDTLRKRIMDNFPKIEGMITRVIKTILWLAEVFGRMAYRGYQAVDQIIQWWKSLDSESKKLLGTLGAIIVAWRMLNSAFLMSPIGLITMLVIALGLLYDDYMTWKEGGNSLIDWAKWEPDIQKAKEAILWVRDKILELKDAVGGWQNVFIAIAAYVAGAWVVKMLAGFAAVSAKLAPLMASLAPVLGLVAYGGYLYSDKENIAASAESSWNYNTRQAKRGIGDGLKWLGIDNPWANRKEGDSSLDPLSAPRGIRNNNPGNINYVGQDGASLERPGGRFAKFETAYDGLKAMARQLMRYFTGKTTGKPLQTLTDIISTWAPGSENNTGAYIAQLSKMLNVHPDAVLNLENPQVMSALMGGIIHHENGRNPYSSELIARAAGGAPQQGLQQETNIYITGVTDPISAGNEVAGRQTNVNARLTQQLHTATR